MSRTLFKALKIKGVGAQQVVEVTGTSTCSKAVPDCIPPKAGRNTLTVKLHRPVDSDKKPTGFVPELRKRFA